MLRPAIQKNDRNAHIVIIAFSVIIIAVVTLLSRVKLDVNLGFNPHIFAQINAVINSAVAVLLVAGLMAVKRKQYKLHRNIMLAAMLLSLLFLISYVGHHLFSGDTLYGDADHNGKVTAAEKTAAGATRTIYIIILSTHILLAGIIMPFVLYTSYRALTAEFPRHKKLARITWPLWLYVAITGVVVYLMIKPYYGA
jgi:putative membrane protein